METFKLLLVLPDVNNERILVQKTEERYCLPAGDKPVGENVGFDEAHVYNGFFMDIAGIPVYRRYTFNTQNHVVFVFEQVKKDNTMLPHDGFDWVAYDDFACDDEEVHQIVSSIRKNYNHSVNMPWVNAHGFCPYFDWLRDACADKNICITGEIAQVKNAYVSTVFRIPTNIGNLFMKIPGKIYITELPLTHELKQLNIADFPEWVDHNPDINAVLMKDMGGSDLPPQSDVDVFKDVVLRFAQIQKEASRCLPLGFVPYDYTVEAILRRLDIFAEEAFEILKGSEHEISDAELDNLKRNILTAKKMLESIKDIPIPDTINYGDIRPGNIRVVGDKFIFYDCAWGSVAHPFFEIVSFLAIIRRSLPGDAKEAIVTAYLQEWLAYGSYDELRYIFSVIEALRHLFFAIVDYDWVKAILVADGEAIPPMSADDWLLERRYYYFASVLKRFLFDTINII